MLRVLAVTAGFGLLAVGVLGTLLPIIPGIPFLILGAALIGKDHPLIRPFAERIERWRNRARGKKTLD
ncbi:MAG TPA: hypothetical protein VIG62_06470 [Blastocatellia bacterium]|jgi:uncharacterized membrane protein YbaN (DUF454 family)